MSVTTEMLEKTVCLITEQFEIKVKKMNKSYLSHNFESNLKHMKPNNYTEIQLSSFDDNILEKVNIRNINFIEYRNKCVKIKDDKLNVKEKDSLDKVLKEVNRYMKRQTFSYHSKIFDDDEWLIVNNTDDSSLLENSLILTEQIKVENADTVKILYNTTDINRNDSANMERFKMLINDVKDKLSKLSINLILEIMQLVDRDEDTPGYIFFIFLTRDMSIGKDDNDEDDSSYETDDESVEEYFE
jgi:hypothetical protein